MKTRWFAFGTLMGMGIGWIVSVFKPKGVFYPPDPNEPEQSDANVNAETE